MAQRQAINYANLRWGKRPFLCSIKLKEFPAWATPFRAEHNKIHRFCLLSVRVEWMYRIALVRQIYHCSDTNRRLRLPLIASNVRVVFHYPRNCCQFLAILTIKPFIEGHCYILANLTRFASARGKPSRFRWPIRQWTWGISRLFLVYCICRSSSKRWCFRRHLRG